MILRCVFKAGGISAVVLLGWLTASSAFTPTYPRGIRPKSICCYNNRLDKGFNILEIASGIVPQGAIVQGAKEGWKFAWQRMMAELAPQDKGGNYQRPSYPFKGRLGTPQFPDEPGRYHLYVGNPCPWCHRTKLAVDMLGFDAQQIGRTVLEDNPVKASRGGWIFSAKQPDPLGNRDLRQLYDQLSPGYQGRCTAPLLVDKKTRKIVSNESSDIVRMLNEVSLGMKKEEKTLNLYPAGLEKEIDDTNEWVYHQLNNGVYRCGFSTLQSAYDRASADVQNGLDRCERILEKQDYLCGDCFTEADLRLLPTILRFDGAYAPLFKAGGAHCRIGNFPAIERWLKRCWSLPGVPGSIDLPDACSSYYKQLFPLNPGGIIPTPVTPKALGLVE
mmetsp:Transcript_9457/g.18099  ORF Transcript_9457/g.18099 Transcript_9457/m.18099 type:complete len:388 (+) Transcript_9457:67-1230(+)